MALIRICLGVVLLYDAVAHWRYAVELYSRSGPPMPLFVRAVAETSKLALSPDDAGVVNLPRVEPLLPVPVPSPQSAVVAQTLLVFAVMSVALGWRTKTSLVAAIVLTLWLAPLDQPGTFAKHTVVALHVLVLLTFSGCGQVWSIDAFSYRREIFFPLSSAAPRRLMQIFVCCVYLGAAVTKLKTPSFTNGDLLTFSFLDDHWACGGPALWLSTMPPVTLMLSIATIFYEVLFPVLIWVPRARLFALGVAATVHTAMGVLLNLETFSPIMLTALLSFARESDLTAFGRFAKVWNVLPRRRGASVLQSPAAGASGTDRFSVLRRFLSRGQWNVCAAVAFASAGIGAQVFFDWYGVFGRHRLPALAEIPARDVSDMLAQRSPPYEDYFHRIEVGSRIGGNQAFGSSGRFRIGQRALVLAQLIQPHPVMELEGLLVMPDGREAARFTRRVDPAFDYTINGFELTGELPPGTYRIILRAEGFSVAERRFELLP